MKAGIPLLLLLALLASSASMALGCRSSGKRKLLAVLLPGAGQSCICPAIYSPVCGAYCRQYSNSCEAGCAGVAVVSDNRCSTGALIPTLSEFPAPLDTSFSTGKRKLQAAAREGCICPALFKPVCSADGRQYGNSCEAGCAGVAVVTDFVPPGGCHVLGGGSSFPRPEFPSLADFPTFPDISFPGSKRKLQ